MEKVIVSGVEQVGDGMDVCYVLFNKYSVSTQIPKLVPWSVSVLHVYTVRQKKRNQFSSACVCFHTRQKLVNFFTYIRPQKSRSISYNSVYLILARVKNFAATVALNILLCLPVK